MDEQVQGEFRNRNFFSKTVVLDASSYTGCVFSKCTMIYSGGEIPALSGCQFNDCTWQFGDKAANTIAFLSGMYQGGFDRLIETTFHEIRRGTVFNQAPAKAPESDTASIAKYLKPLRVFRVPKQET